MLSCLSNPPFLFVFHYFLVFFIQWVGCVRLGYSYRYSVLTFSQDLLCGLLFTTTTTTTTTTTNNNNNNNNTFNRENKNIMNCDKTLSEGNHQVLAYQ